MRVELGEEGERVAEEKGEKSMMSTMPQAFESWGGGGGGGGGEKGEGEGRERKIK